MNAPSGRTAQSWYVDYINFFDCERDDAVKLVMAIQADALRLAVDAIRFDDGYDGNLDMLEPALKLARKLEKQC